MTRHTEKKRSILALDLGTTTGWAMRTFAGKICSGTQSFKETRFSGAGMRFVNFERWLEDFGHVQIVYFEEVRRHLGVDAAHAYGGFWAHLTAFCEKQGIPYQGVPVGTIKLFIAGKGNANKEAVIASVRELGHTPKDDNEADALALLHYAINRHPVEGGLPLKGRMYV